MRIKKEKQSGRHNRWKFNWKTWWKIGEKREIVTGCVIYDLQIFNKKFQKKVVKNNFWLVIYFSSLECTVESWHSIFKAYLMKLLILITVIVNIFQLSPIKLLSFSIFSIKNSNYCLLWPKIYWLNNNQHFNERVNNKQFISSHAVVHVLLIYFREDVRTIETSGINRALLYAKASREEKAFEVEESKMKIFHDWKGFYHKHQKKLFNDFKKMHRKNSFSWS